MPERQAAPKVEITEAIQPQAHVTDTFVSPPQFEKSPMWDVAKALKDLNPKIGEMFDQLGAAENKRQEKLGELKPFLDNPERSADQTALFSATGGQQGVPNFANPGFSKGVGKSQGANLGLDFGGQMELAYSTNPTLKQTDDSGAFDTWFKTETAAKFGAYRNNPAVIEGLMPHLYATHARLHAQWIKDRVEYKNGVATDSFIGQAGRELDNLTSQAGSPDATDLTAATAALSNARDQAYSTGLERQKVNKLVADTIVSKAIYGRSQKLLSLLDTVTDENGLPLSNTEHGRDLFNKTTEHIDSLNRAAESERTRAKAAADKQQKDGMTAEFYQNLRKDPHYEPSEDWLRKMETVDPDFTKGIETGRQAVLNGNTAEDPNMILRLQSDILGGDGDKAIRQAIISGQLRKPETRATMLKLQESVSEQATKPFPILAHPQFKFLETQVAANDKPAGQTSIFGDVGLSNSGREAINWAKMQAMEHALKFPDEDNTARQKYLMQLGEDTLNNFQGQNQGLHTQGQPTSTFNKPGTPPPAPPAPLPNEPARQPQAPTPQPSQQAPAGEVVTKPKGGAVPQPAPRTEMDRLMEMPAAPAIKDAGLRKDQEEAIRARAKKEGMDPQALFNAMWTSAKQHYNQQTSPGSPQAPSGPEAPSTQPQQGSGAPKAAPRGRLGPIPQNFNQLPVEDITSAIHASLSNIEVPGVGNLGQHLTPEVMQQIARTFMPVPGAGELTPDLEELRPHEPVPTAGDLTPDLEELRQHEPASGAGELPTNVPIPGAAVPTAGTLSTAQPAPRPVATAGKLPTDEGFAPRRGPTMHPTLPVRVDAPQATAKPVTPAPATMGVRGELDKKIDDAIRTAKTPMQIARSFVGKNETDHRDTLGAFFQGAAGSKLDPAVTPWCARFARSVLSAAGIKTKANDMARSFLGVGQGVDPSQAKEGDIIVFPRPGSPTNGHVGFVQSVDVAKGTVTVLGGNQGGKAQKGGGVTVQTFPLGKALGIRRVSKTWVSANLESLNADTATA